MRFRVLMFPVRKDKIQAVIIVGIVLVTGIVVQAVCPSSCDCKREIEADCSNRSFNSLPFGGFSRNLQRFDISFNNIKVIEGLTMRRRNIPSLMHLNLSNNIINKIENVAFMGLGDLQVIDLSSNNITTLHNDTFRYPPKLKWLSLAYNHLQVLLGIPFLISDSLEVLHLEHCGFTEISFHTFERITYLRELYLSKNDIKTIIPDSGSSLRQLKVLNLSDNLLKRLHEEVISLPNLENLNYTNNKIKSVNEMFDLSSGNSVDCESHSEL
ncbi:hypothetical protein C0J52_09375 [Blattella germanica]|nr:hypothetical protein C0J52_09375 [Blattella germanica]